MSVDALVSRFNPLVAWVLRSRLHGLLSSGLMLLSFTGRSTGRRFTIPVGYQREGSEITVMVSEARRKTWWRNCRDGAPVELVLRGGRIPGRAEVLDPASEPFRSRAEATLRRLPWLGRVFGIDYDRLQGLRPDQVTRLGEEIAIVRITLA